ncbi:MAG: ABC transporter substrate-binding protein [Planctomycetes bacterium]|nr:ABC transporter substrate-binding protein [Planctomycetota bacterium]
MIPALRAVAGARRAWLGGARTSVAARFAATLLLLASSACGPDTEPTAPRDSHAARAAESTSSGAEVLGAEMTGAESAGRTGAASGASAPARQLPRRIVAASATAVDFVCALVEPERVVGVPEQAVDYSVLHARADGSSVPPRDEWARAKRFYAYEAEPVLALEPDLVLVDPYQSRDTTARLREAGVDVLELPEVRDVAGAIRALRSVAERVGATERAATLCADLERRIAALAATRARRASVRALCYSNFGSQGWTAGADTTIAEVMRLAGLRNLAAEAGRVGHGTIAFEELLGLDPDLVIVSAPLSTPAGSAGDRGGASEAILLTEPTLASLRAVREKRVLVLPAWLFATGSHEMVPAAEELASAVDRLLARQGEETGSAETGGPETRQSRGGH